MLCTPETANITEFVGSRKTATYHVVATNTIVLQCYETCNDFRTYSKYAILNVEPVSLPSDSSGMP